MGGRLIYCLVFFPCDPWKQAYRFLILLCKRFYQFFAPTFKLFASSRKVKNKFANFSLFLLALHLYNLEHYRIFDHNFQYITVLQFYDEFYLSQTVLAFPFCTNNGQNFPCLNSCKISDTQKSKNARKF